MLPESESAALPPFSAEVAAAVLDTACRDAGLDPSGAGLLRMGENAIYHLRTAPVVVRIARSMELLPDVVKEVAVARWLAEADFPAVRLHDDLMEPMVVAGRPVTFWEYIDQEPPEPTLPELGTVLRGFHALHRPSWLELPALDPFGRVGERLDVIEGVDDRDVAFLRDRLAALRRAYEGLAFDLPPGHVHGDAHTGNLLRRAADGQLLLIDFERFAVGPREWDLVEPALEHHRLGWETADSYAGFVERYGFDVAEWPGFDVLCSIRELTMTTWLMQNVGHSAEIAAEFRTRIASLRDGSPRRWRPF